MDRREIKKKRQEVEMRLRVHDAQRKSIEAELEVLRSTCTHPKLKTWTHHDYAGGSDYNESCEDCGYRTCV